MSADDRVTRDAVGLPDDARVGKVALEQQPDRLISDADIRAIEFVESLTVLPLEETVVCGRPKADCEADRARQQSTVTRLSRLVDVQAEERDTAVRQRDEARAEVERLQALLGGSLYSARRRLEQERDHLQAQRDDLARFAEAVVHELRAEVVGHVDDDACAVLDEVLGEGWAEQPPEPVPAMWCGCPDDTDVEHRSGADARALASTLRECGAPPITTVVGWCGKHCAWRCSDSGDFDQWVITNDGDRMSPEAFRARVEEQK